jgi:arylsulfatase A-like enzyme
MWRHFHFHFHFISAHCNPQHTQVLDELDRLGLSGNTAVVLHSDHGWHLGESNMWEVRSTIHSVYYYNSA